MHIRLLIPYHCIQQVSNPPPLGRYTTTIFQSHNTTHTFLIFYQPQQLIDLYTAAVIIIHSAFITQSSLFSARSGPRNLGGSAGLQASSIQTHVGIRWRPGFVSAAMARASVRARACVCNNAPTAPAFSVTSFTSQSSSTAPSFATHSSSGTAGTRRVRATV